MHDDRKSEEPPKQEAAELDDDELAGLQGGTAGKQLLAHELTHVGQSGGSKVASTASGSPDGLKAKTGGKNFASTASGSPNV